VVFDYGIGVVGCGEGSEFSGSKVTIVTGYSSLSGSLQFAFPEHGIIFFMHLTL
jgi:hypothetical protein